MQNNDEHYEQEFHALLAMFATNSKVQLNQAMIRVYDRAVQPFGYKKASAAITELMNEVKSWQMPTPKQIIDKIDNKLPPQMLANEITGRIFEAVSRYGYASATDSKAYIGEIGWLAVKTFGGWSHICQELGVTLDKNSTRAQMRDFLISIIATDEKGQKIMALEHKPKELPFIKLLSSAKEFPK